MLTSGEVGAATADVFSGVTGTTARGPGFAAGLGTEGACLSAAIANACP